MTITEIKVPVGALVQGFEQDDTTGRVRAWRGKLDVRPEYQREYVYDDKQRDAVINTVLNGFPLNIMYFVKRDDGTYEVLDGQQRIISLCQFVNNSAISFDRPSKTNVGKFDTVNFPNLFDEEVAAFMNYKLQVYICEGTEKEKIDWFQVINIAGEELEPQEILNAVLHSKWLTDAKSVFSRRNCAAQKKYGKYLSGDVIRQKYLETAFRWKADDESISGKDAVSQFMQKHRGDEKADDLWKYVEDVFSWVQKNFGKTIDKSMKGVEWGLLYNAHRDDTLDPDQLQADMKKLLADPEVKRKSGIYEYLLTDEEKLLSLRQFEEHDRVSMYHAQNGKCAMCGKHFAIEEMHADHIKPWSKGGKTEISNGQMLCAECNLKKGAIE